MNDNHQMKVRKGDPITYQVFNVVAEQSYRSTRWSVDTSTGLTFSYGPQGYKLGFNPTDVTWSGYTTDAMKPQVGNTPGSGPVKFVSLLGSADGPWYDTGRTDTAVNGTGGSVPAGIYCGGHFFEGVPIVTWANCAGSQAAPAPLPQPSAQPMSASSGEALQDGDGQPIVAS